MKKVVIYINQFFGQIGGEEKADYAPQIFQDKIGPAVLLNSMLEGAEVTHTIICGDNYMASNQTDAINTILNYLSNIEFDYFVAGPAFQAGRYGNACGAICSAVEEKFKVPVMTSMHIENAGIDVYREKLIIFEGSKSAAMMKNDMKKIALALNKLVAGESLEWADKEGYFPTGKRKEVWIEGQENAAKRAVDMMIRKLNNLEYVSELPIKMPEHIPVANAIKNMELANIAIVTTGGIVPVDNPDRIQSASATRWGKYDISNEQSLKAGVYKTIHAGFDPTVANSNPNVIVPLDVLRDMEKDKKIGKIHKYFYSTVGTGTTQAEASRMGKEISKCLLEDKVDGVILVST